MRPGLASAFAVGVLAATIGVRAQQAPTPQRTMIPMAASSILMNPDAHYGEYVSLPAAVEQILSRTTFSVDQDKTKPTGKELLIISPTLQEAPELNTYVTIVGEVIKPSAQRIDRDSTLDPMESPKSQACTGDRLPCRVDYGENLRLCGLERNFRAAILRHQAAVPRVPSWGTKRGRISSGLHNSSAANHGVA